MTIIRGVIAEELGNGTVEVFSLPTDEATLTSLVTEIFTDWWEHIHFGVIVQGAAWEVAAPCAPVGIGSLDGYITVDFGRWHFHLCLGEHTASGPELGRIRRCARAELYRILYDGKPGKETTEPMKIYTRKGDTGQTSIWGGRRLSKDDARVEAIGAVDDCNAAIGSATARRTGRHPGHGAGPAVHRRQ